MHVDMSRIYEQHAQAVYQLAMGILRNEQEAEDLTHDVFVRIWRGGFDETRGSIRHYLLLVTRSMGFNRLRQGRNRWRILNVFRPGFRLQEPLDLQSAEEVANLHQALACLNEKEQKILMMNYSQSMSQSAIAAALDLPLGTVKSISRRALLKLRHQISSASP